MVLAELYYIYPIVHARIWVYNSGSAKFLVYEFKLPSESFSTELLFVMEETREKGACFAQRLMS